MRALVACLLFVGCQTGVEQAANAAPGAPAPDVAGGATPMRVVAARAVADVGAPWTLTASDGSGLTLRRVEARAVTEGPLAFTELHLWFHNAEARTREGTFVITLPQGAAVSRFAMENAGEWQEAEVVEKMRARRVYEDFLHRKQDPALLEKSAGNQFSARVFPIAAKAEKHLVISYSQELLGRGYALPLRGLPKVAQVDVALDVMLADGTRRRQTLAERNWQPDRDFVAESVPVAAAVAAGEMVAGVLTLEAGAASGSGPVAFGSAPLGFASGADVPDRVTIAVDTSASRALGFRAYVASVRELIAALRTRHGERVRVQVIAFDQDSEVIFDGRAADYGDAQDEALVARGAAGASDLGQLVATLAKRTPHRRVVVITDGVVTAGADEPVLTAAIARLPVERLDVLLAGGIRDERMAAAIARAGLPRAGYVHDLDDGASAVAAALGESVRTDVAIEIPGATWVYPRTVPALRAGAPFMVFARFDKPPGGEVQVIVGGEKRSIVVGAATEPLIARAIAGAEIAELETRLAATADAKAAATVREDIVRRSIAARVMSSQTSMLVLETEADYDRFQIERTALADIMTIGPGGIEVEQRTKIAAAPKRPTSRAVPADRVAMPTTGASGPDTPQAGAPRQDAIDQAWSAGVIGNSGGSFASLTGTGDISSGFDEGKIGLVGGDDEVTGGFGFGRSGFGPGGGGSGAAGSGGIRSGGGGAADSDGTAGVGGPGGGGWGTIGVGRYGTIGRGSGTGSGYGVGGGAGGMRGRSAAVPAVTLGRATVMGSLDKDVIRRYVRRSMARIQYCYEKELVGDPALAGDVQVSFTITSIGHVTDASVTGMDPEVAACLKRVIEEMRFPSAPGIVRVTYPFNFRPADGVAAVSAPPAIVDEPPPRRTDPAADEDPKKPALKGKLAEVMGALRAKKLDRALSIARAWHDDAPGDVLALIAMGEVMEAKKDTARAARIYGSIIDLFPGRADLRRFAGERLERLGAPARGLAVDTYRRAVADRPDHVAGHRLLAYALLRGGDHAGAFAAILAGLDQKYPSGRFRGSERILGEDAGMIAAVYVANGGPRDDVTRELEKRSLEIATRPSTRFVMYWETDANDVDFHIRDARGGHAWYGDKKLPSGGELYADVTTGYGPECFTIPGTPRAGPYRLSINYYSQGPMGYGMGLLQIQRFDGKALTFDDRPYVIMNDHAFVDLGTFR